MRLLKARAKILEYFAQKLHLTSSFLNSSGGATAPGSPPSGAHDCCLSDVSFFLHERMRRTYTWGKHIWFANWRRLWWADWCDVFLNVWLLQLVPNSNLVLYGAKYMQQSKSRWNNLKAALSHNNDRRQSYNRSNVTTFHRFTDCVFGEGNCDDESSGLSTTVIIVIVVSSG